MFSNSLAISVLNRLIAVLDNLELHEYSLFYLEKLSKSDDEDVRILASGILVDRKSLSSIANFLESLKDVFSYLK